MWSAAELPGTGPRPGAPRSRTAPALSPNREDLPMGSVTAEAASAGRAPAPPPSRAGAGARKGGGTACAG